jgi:hypothetical protein
MACGDAERADEAGGPMVNEQRPLLENMTL